MKRRDFVALLGCASAAWPRIAHAQPSSKVFRVGFLGIARRDEPLSRTGYDRFFQVLSANGFVEGKNLEVSVVASGGHEDQFPRLAAEFIARKVDVIVAVGSAATRAAAGATSTIPIVMAAVPNPELLGLVQSLARPGKNVTGFSTMLADVNRKLLDVMKEALPDRTRVAYLGNSDNPGSAGQLKNWPRVAEEYGLVPISADIRKADELPGALEHFTKERAEVLWPAPVWWTLHAPVLAYASKQKLPVILNFRQWVPHGALLSYGPDLVDNFGQVALYVVKILNGADPANMPVQQPTKFELAINLKTANSLGLKVPSSLLARADEVIE